jgi:hypothetical protein
MPRRQWLLVQLAYPTLPTPLPRARGLALLGESQRGPWGCGEARTTRHVFHAVPPPSSFFFYLKTYLQLSLK